MRPAKGPCRAAVSAEMHPDLGNLVGCVLDPVEQEDPLIRQHDQARVKVSNGGREGLLMDGDDA